MPRPKPKSYPFEINTIGGHIRATRMDHGLEIAEVASLLGVVTQSIVDWEHGHSTPHYTYGAKILTFLGYCPFEEPTNLGDHMRLWRWKRGFKQKQAAAAIGVDPATWSTWERNVNQPFPSSLRRLVKHQVLPGGFTDNGKYTVPHLLKDARRQKGRKKRFNPGATKSPRNH